MRFFHLILLLLGRAVEGAVLRTAYIDQNGKDVRLEVFVDRWWTDNVSERARIPAGTVLKRRNGTTLLETNETIPVDLLLEFRNPTPRDRARLAFTVKREGNMSLQLSRYYPVASCTSTVSECFQCGLTSFQSQTTTVMFEYGRFQDPPSSSKVAYTAELSTQYGSLANITWDTSFPRNQMGNSSNVNITGWIVYLSGALGDTGKVVVDQLAQFKSFSADALPEGFIVPATVVDIQSYLDFASQQWRQAGCPTDPGAAPPLQPVQTLAHIITNWTNAFYGGKNIRSCAFETLSNINSTTRVDELTCSYDDLDLAVVIRFSDGLQLLDRLRHAPPPPPPPPSPPSAQAPPAILWNRPSPPPPVGIGQEPPATSQGLNGCFITNSDCGDHGTLKALPSSGCTCVCELGWRNAGQPSSSKYYCSEFTGLPASPPPPPLSSADLWKNITSTPPPPPKVYVSDSWWERLGPGGWLGLTCGLVVIGVVAVLCSCHGRQLWTRCCLSHWQRPARKQQQAYEQIQALRQQLQDLQKKMAAD